MKEHPYDKVVELLKKVSGETHKHCSYEVNVYDYRPDIRLQLYLEDGWIGRNVFAHHEVVSLDEAVAFLKDFLKERASRGVLFKKF